MASRTGALFDECAFTFVPSTNLTTKTIDLVRQQSCPLFLVEAGEKVKVDQVG